MTVQVLPARAAKCVFGYFTKDLVTTADTVLGGPDMGATTVQVIG